LILLKKTYLLILILLAISFAGFTQNPTETNSTTHSPKKATIYSAVLPGLGQAYNKKYWKIPVAYVGIGAFSYMAYNNQVEFNRYRNAYLIREAGGEDEFYNYITSSQGLINSMDKYRKQRDLCFIGAVVIYAIQIVDANVDANLFDFDISDDLSMRLYPVSFNQAYSKTPVFGVSCAVKF
jgi:hypothetical protein